MASTRSPSPNPSRPSNPSPKTLQNSSVLSKSGTFPSKPFISSEIPQWNSSSKSSSALPSPRASFEQKENERDLNCIKPARRSPAMNPYKGKKSFMAPTISASSKITAASPRKKILSERNEVVQDSVKSPSVLDEGVEVEEFRPKSEMGFDSEEISGRNRSRMMDFSCSRGHHQSTGNHSPSCCTSDADPSLPPYDPMINYISPRPQFLRYKPKPMIEQNHGFMEDLNDVGDGRRLEDSFFDTEGSDDCSEHTEGTNSSSVCKEVEDEYASPRLRTHENLVPDESHVFESKPRAKTYKPRLHNRSLRKSKIIPFLLVLSILFCRLPLADLPIFSPVVIKYESFAGPHTQSFGVPKDVHLKDHLAFASRNIEGLVSRLRQWLLDSIVVLSSSGPILREESDMILSFNMTPSPSIVQNVGLDFGYSSELEAVRKKGIAEGQDGPVNSMESDFELDKIVRNALVGNDIDDGEKISFEFSDVNGDGAIGEMVQEQEEGKYARYEEGLNSFTDPVFEFGTMNKKDQPKKIGVAISEEVDRKGCPVGFEMVPKKIDVAICEEFDGKGCPVGFDIVQMLKEEVLVDLRRE